MLYKRRERCVMSRIGNECEIIRKTFKAAGDLGFEKQIQKIK